MDGWWPGDRPNLINFQVEKMEEGQVPGAAEGGKGGQGLAFPPRKQAVALPPAVTPEACLWKAKPIKDV